MFCAPKLVIQTKPDQFCRRTASFCVTVASVDNLLKCNGVNRRLHIIFCRYSLCNFGYYPVQNTFAHPFKSGFERIQNNLYHKKYSEKSNTDEEILRTLLEGRKDFFERAKKRLKCPENSIYSNDFSFKILYLCTALFKQIV